MISQVDKNKEILYNEIEGIACERMTETVAAKLSVYGSAYQALCLAQNKDASEPRVARQPPESTPEMDGDTEFERIIMAMPVDKPHLTQVAQVINRHLECLKVVNARAYNRIIDQLAEIAAQ